MIPCFHMAAASACIVLLNACAPPDDDTAPPLPPESIGEVETGHITGSILYTNPPGPVSTFLTSQTVRFPTDPTVSATHATDPIENTTVEYTLLETLPAIGSKYPVFRPASH